MPFNSPLFYRDPEEWPDEVSIRRRHSEPVSYVLFGAVLGCFGLMVGMEGLRPLFMTIPFGLVVGLAGLYLVIYDGRELFRLSLPALVVENDVVAVRRYGSAIFQEVRLTDVRAVARAPGRGTRTIVIEDADGEEVRIIRSEALELPFDKVINYLQLRAGIPASARPNG